MTSAAIAPLLLGRISGHRGLRGEVTLKVVSGRAERWVHLHRALVGGGVRAIASARAYRDRLVLKFQGVDDANGAEALRGAEVSVPASDLPALPEGEFWAQQLIGLSVVETGGGALGLVEDIVETGGTDLLLVRETNGDEILVPLASAIVRAVDTAGGRIEVSLPDGLREVNAPEEGPA
ncbi:MAG TPA: ribosome maturation factor RimM [Candidatus Polarisedimenticolaceae bacterium]|nr:ribosome maturation factor RimM [Candidatus Polarisedimenticolaceae bacterium]